MKNKPAKKKLCWNCEGAVSLESENCSFCGVYLSSLGTEDKNDLFSPPFRMEVEEENEVIPAPPYVHEETASLKEESVSVPVAPVVAKGQPTSTVLAIFLPLFLLLSGTIFSLFGLVLFLFSHNNTLVLRWDASYWGFYLFPAILMLIFGWFSLSKISEE